MAENEKIGGVEIGVTADFSELDQQFEAAVSKAVAEGATLGEAIAKATQSAAGDLGQLAQAVDKVGSSLEGLSGSTPPMEDIRSALAGIRSEAEEAAKAAKDLADKAAQADFKEFADNVEQWIKSPMRSAGAAAKELVLELGPLGMAAAAGAAGVALLGKEITGLVLSEGQAAEKTQLLADRLNLSIDQTQKYSEMAQVAGVSLGVLTRTSMRLAEAIYDSEGAGKKVAASLDSMGIAASNSGELLVKVLEHLAAIPDSTKRIAEEHEILGRGAVELEPLIKNYDALLAVVDKLGGRLSSEVVAKLAAADDAADLLGKAWDHLKGNLAGAFAPAVTAGLEMLTRLLGGAPTLTLDQQIHNLRIEMEELAAASTRTAIGVTSMMGGGLTQLPTTSGQLSSKQMELDALLGQKQAAEWSKDYNDAVDASNRAAEKLRQSQAAALKEMNDALRAFNDSVVTLYNTFPKTYEQYVQRLQDGGKTAKSMLGEIEGDILRAQSVMVGMSGAPLQGMKDWVDALEGLKKTTKEWVALDTAQKFDDLARKFETAEMKFRGLADVKLAESPFPKQWFTDTHDFLALMDKLQTAVMKIGEQAQGKKEVAQILALPAVKDVLALGEAVKHFGLVREQDVATTLKQNALIQASDELTLREKVEAEAKSIHEIQLMRNAEMFGRLQNEIKWKELSGADATAEIKQLKDRKDAVDRLYESTHLLGDLYVDLKNNFGRAFDQLGKSMADNIIDQKNWHDVWQSTIKSIGKMFLEDLIGTAFKALHNSIEETTGLFSKMSGAITSVVGKAVGILPGGANAFAGQGGNVLALTKVNGKWVDATGTPVGAAGDIGGVAPVNLPGELPPGAEGFPGMSAAGNSDYVGGASKPPSSGGGLGSLSNITSLASLGVSIASGITSGIQNSRMINLLGEIEISTRQTKEQLTGGVQTSLNTYLPQLLHLTDIWSELVNGHLGKIQDVLWWGVINANIANFGSGGGSFGTADFSWSQGQLDASNAQSNLTTGGQTGQPGQVVSGEDVSGASPIDARSPRTNVGNFGAGLPRLQPFHPAASVPAQLPPWQATGNSIERNSATFANPNSPAFHMGLPQTVDQIIQQLAGGMGANTASVVAELTDDLKRFENGPGAFVPKGTSLSDYLIGNFTEITDKGNLNLRNPGPAGQATFDYQKGLISADDYFKAFAQGQDKGLQPILGAFKDPNGVIPLLQASGITNQEILQQLQKMGLASFTNVGSGGDLSSLHVGNALSGTVGGPNGIVGLSSGYAGKGPILRTAPGGAATSMTGGLTSDQTANALSQYTAYLQGVQSTRDQEAQFGNNLIGIQQSNQAIATAIQGAFPNMMPADILKLPDYMLQAASSMRNIGATPDQIRSALIGSQPYSTMTGTGSLQIKQAFGQPVDVAGMTSAYSTKLNFGNVSTPPLSTSTWFGGYPSPAPTSGVNGTGTVITVNALDPSARGVARAIGTAITETGRSVR